MNQKGSNQKILFTIAIIIILVALIAFIHVMKGLKPRPVDVTSSREHPRIKGSPQAPLKIEEFTDFLCPACAVGTKILDVYMKEHPDDIRLVYRYYPIITLHPNALPSAVYAECAGAQGKFWEYHDRLIPKAKAIHKAKGDDVFRHLLDIAEECGLDMDRLRQCVSDPKTEEIIVKEKELGNSMGVKATPTYFVNGKIVVGHIALKEELKKYFKDNTHESSEIPKGSHSH
jgi:protein-disulfide isomerase